MQPDLLRCPDCGKTRTAMLMTAHLAIHGWSMAAIQSFIANGGVCRMAKTFPVKPSSRSAHA